MPIQFFQNTFRIWHILFTFLVPVNLIAQEIAVHSQSDAEAHNDLLRDLEGVRIDLNHAKVQQFLELPYLTPDLAQNIIAQRPYRQIEDLLSIPGLAPEHFELISPYLSLSPIRPWQSAITLRASRPSNHANTLENLRLYQRVEITTPNNISGFILTERDPKELSLTDHITSHLVIPIKNTTLTVGDIRPHWGQGLIFSRRTRATTGLSGARSYTTNQSGNRTSTEHGALRGIHLRQTHKYLTLIGLYGQTTWDASLNPNSPPRLYTTGLHQNETARQRKHALTERLIAGHLQLGTPSKHLGITVLHTAFTPRAPDQHTPLLFSINGQWRTKLTTLFGELTPKAYLAGLVAGTPKLRLHILARTYSDQFYSLHGAPFAAYGTPSHNEWGIFYGLTWRWNTRTRIALSLDRHKRLVSEKGQLPPKGERIRLDLYHRIASKLTARLTADTRRATYKTTRRSARLSIRHKPAFYNFTAWAQKTHADASGQAAGFRLTLGKTKGPSCSLWITHHNVSDFDARIYDFEPDVWGGTRLLTLSGRGTNRGMRLAWSTQHFRIATRYSHHRTSSWAVQIDLRL